VKAIDATKAMLIGPSVFQAAMQKSPMWLASIIKIIVSRLRDANRRVDQTILRDRERGIVALMLMLLPKNKIIFASAVALPYDLVLVEAYFVCRLKKNETKKLVADLQTRGLVEMDNDTQGKAHICMKDVEVLQLYEEYLTLRSQRKTFKEAGIPEEELAVLNNIAYVSQKQGAETGEGTMLLKSALAGDLTHTTPEQLDKILLNLKRKALISMLPADNDDATIIFDRDTLSRVKKITQWLPRFQEEIQQEVKK
jgi:hypothetical protein